MGWTIHVPIRIAKVKYSIYGYSTKWQGWKNTSSILNESLDPLLDSGIQLYTDKYGEIESKFLKVFQLAKAVLEWVRPFEEKLSEKVELFDFVYPSGERVKGNGFRSLLYVYHSA